MDKGLRAVFYEYKYYLLPEGVTIEEIKASEGEMTLPRLAEEQCMAPNFIYESMREETVSFTEPDHAFEVSVNLCSAEEYDKILQEQVDRVCPGCSSYTNEDEPGLHGHHREISLSGVCYDRVAENEEKSFSYMVGWFWWSVGKRLKELAACIDVGNQKKLNKILNSYLTKISYPLRFYGTIVDGKYRLCISVDRLLPFSYSSIAAYIALLGNDKDGQLYKEGWTVEPFFEKGVFRYDGKKTFGDDEPKICIRQAQFPFRYKIEVYHKQAEKLSEKKCAALIDEVHDRIRAAIGEEKELMLILGYGITGDKDGAISLNEAAKELERASKENAVEDMEKSFPPYIGCGREQPLPEDKALPYKSLVRTIMTCAFDVTLADREEIKASTWWTDFFTYAYIVLPGAENFNQTLYWYLSNFRLVTEPLHCPDDDSFIAMSTGFGEYDGGLFVDMFLFDEKAMFRRLRIIAPILRALSARLITVNAGGVKEYVCDYDLELVSRGE